MSFKVEQKHIIDELKFTKDLLYVIENRNADYCKIRLDNYYTDMLKKRIEIAEKLISKKLGKAQLESILILDK